MRLPLSILLASASLGFAAPARAHITLMFPKRTATSDADQKGPAPCGVQRARNPQTFKPGETIEVIWRETVPHPGHFRIAFDDDGKDFPTR